MIEAGAGLGGLNGQLTMQAGRGARKKGQLKHAAGPQQGVGDVDNKFVCCHVVQHESDAPASRAPCVVVELVRRVACVARAESGAR